MSRVSTLVCEFISLETPLVVKIFQIAANFKKSTYSLKTTESKLIKINYIKVVKTMLLTYLRTSFQEIVMFVVGLIEIFTHNFEFNLAVYFCAHKIYLFVNVHYKLFYFTL